MQEELLIRPIAHIRTDFHDKFGVPRQSGRVPCCQSSSPYSPSII